MRWRIGKLLPVLLTVASVSLGADPQTTKLVQTLDHRISNLEKRVAELESRQVTTPPAPAPAASAKAMPTPAAQPAIDPACFSNSRISVRVLEKKNLTIQVVAG